MNAHPEKPPIADVIAIAHEAGRAIMEKMNKPLEKISKPDGSFVTPADIAANQIVMQGLRNLTPGIPILSEESPERTGIAKSGLYWIVDPMDGTNTAIRYAEGAKDRNQFGVQIALVKDGVPILGVAHYPAMAEGHGVTYYTGDDGKAYKQTGTDEPKQLHLAPAPAGTLRAAVHYKRRAPDIAGRPYEAVTAVGGFRICLAAEGAVHIADMNDIPLELTDKAYKKWDLAAPHAIILAAGGDLVSAVNKPPFKKGEPLTYDGDDDKMPGCYAGSNETLLKLNLTKQVAPSGLVR